MNKSAWWLPLLLAISGTSKLAAIDDFGDSVAKFSFLTGGSVAVVTIIVPAVEFVPLGMMIVKKPRVGQVLAILLIIIFSCGYVFELVRMGSAPQCNCFGLIQKWISDRTSAQSVITRNAFLILSASATLALSWRTPSFPQEFDRKSNAQ
jgi:hypothetical protein